MGAAVFSFRWLRVTHGTRIDGARARCNLRTMQPSAAFWLQRSITEQARNFDAPSAEMARVIRAIVAELPGRLTAREDCLHGRLL